jgi:transposase InsO family protein
VAKWTAQNYANLIKPWKAKHSRRLNVCAANNPLRTITLVRIRSEPRTRAYVARRTAEGKSTKEIQGCLKRYIARELYPLNLADLKVAAIASSHRSVNSVMERFFLNLKMKRVWQRDYVIHHKAINDITDYIVNFYKSKKLHSTLGYLPPTTYEQQIAENTPITVS